MSYYSLIRYHSEKNYAREKPKIFLLFIDFYAFSLSKMSINCRNRSVCPFFGIFLSAFPDRSGNNAIFLHFYGKPFGKRALFFIFYMRTVREMTVFTLIFLSVTARHFSNLSLRGVFLPVIARLRNRRGNPFVYAAPLGSSLFARGDNLSLHFFTCHCEAA